MDRLTPQGTLCYKGTGSLVLGLIARFSLLPERPQPMFPRRENFLAVFAVTAIVVTAAFWALPPELRFPEPRQEAGVSSASPVEAPIEVFPAPNSGSRAAAR